MKVFITGICGFVGPWVARELIERGHEVTGLAMIQPNSPAISDWSRIPYVMGDILDADGVSRAMESATHVLHLAGISTSKAGDEARRINVDGTRTILKAANGRRMVLASSGYVYGPTSPDRPAREDDTLNPMGEYAVSKAEMETMANREFAEAEVVIARAFNHTGPGQSTAFFVPAMCEQLAKIQAGKQFPMLSVGNLEASREMLDVRDVARAYADLLACVKPPRVVNIACGKPHTMQELLKNLLATVHVPISVTRDPARSAPSDLPCSTGDPSLLRQATGWTPEVPLETTLRDTLNWWKERVRAGSVR